MTSGRRRQAGSRFVPVLARWLHALAFASFALGLPAAQATTFRAADNQVEDYPTVQALMFMDRMIQEKTGGRHRIRVFHSGPLGEEKHTIEQTRIGAIDIDRVNVTPLAALIPAANALLLPFLFRSTDHLHAVLDGPIGDDILATLDTAGFVGLTFYDSGARSIYNDVRPVRALADLAGLKIRVQPSDLMVDTMLALGAKPVQLSYGQVLPALQTKLVDGAENNWPSYVSTGHYRVARHLTLTEHTTAPEVLLMSRRAWGTLSPEDQAIFREAARASKMFMRARWRDWEEETRRQAAASGAAIVSDFDREAFKDATAGVRGKYMGNADVRALVERIEAAR